MFQPNEQLYTALGIEAAKLHAVEYADRFSVWTRNDVCYCCCWCFMFHSTLHLYELVWSRKDHNRSNTFILTLFNNHRLTRFEAFFFSSYLYVYCFGSFIFLAIHLCLFDTTSRIAVLPRNHSHQFIVCIWYTLACVTIPLQIPYSILIGLSDEQAFAYGSAT